MSLTIVPHVIVGGGHFVSQGTQLAQQCMQNLPKVTSAFDRVIQVCKSSSERSEQIKEYAIDQLERTKDGLIDLGLAFGNGAAGDYEAALQNSIDAANKAAEIFVEQLKFAWP